jgi:hypothetical protein
MTTENLTLPKFLDLLEIEAQRGIINMHSLLDMMLGKGIPKIIVDVRGDVRLAIERSGDDFEVTKYMTDLVKEKIQNERTPLDLQKAA